MALGSGGKILGLPVPVAAGAAALVLGVGFFWWRRRQASSGAAGAGSAASPVPADGTTGIPGTAGSMTDNFYITINEQQDHRGGHGKPGHKHPHPKSDHDRDDRKPPQSAPWVRPGRDLPRPQQWRRPPPVTRGR